MSADTSSSWSIIESITKNLEGENAALSIIVALVVLLLLWAIFFISKQNSTESSSNATSSNSDRLEFVPSYKSDTSVQTQINTQTNISSPVANHKQAQSIDVVELETASPKRNSQVKDTETSIIQVAAEFKKSSSGSLDSKSQEGSGSGSGGMVSPLRKRPSRSIHSPNRFSPSGKLVNTELVLGLRRSSSGVKKEKESQESVQTEEVEARSSSPTKTRSKSLRSSRSRV